MKKYFWILFIALLATGIVMAVNSNRISFGEYESVDSTKVAVNDDFNKMMDVLTHKRCVNCHPNDNVPKQGNDSHPHYFDIKRGEENLGFQATKCTTCHQSENNKYSGVPGAPHWSLAPASMQWEGLSRIEIAESMMDPLRNGNRSVDDILHHLTEDELVLWAFNPGVDSEGVLREKPPLTKEEYIMAVKNWFAAGAIIPKP